MSFTEVQTGVLNAGSVSAQATPNMTVAVAAGTVVAGDVALAIVAGNVTIGAADAQYDRIDWITVPAGGTPTVVPGTAQLGPVYPPVSSDPLLASVYVKSRATPDFTGTITSDVIADQRTILGLSAGQLNKRTVYTSGTGTHTFQSATKTVRLIVVGGGGGGGGSSTGTVSQSSAAAGGGGGGTCDVVVTIGANTTLTYTVGASGAGGPAGNNNGSAGGNSTAVLGATTYTGSGGGGGQGSTAVSNTTQSVSGGAGGGATNGDLNIHGADGHPGTIVAGSPGLATSGVGGSSQWGGGGGVSTGAPGNGTAGGNYGGGGAGGNSVGAGAHSGGAGSVGCVIVEEYT